MKAWVVRLDISPRFKISRVKLVLKNKKSFYVTQESMSMFQTSVDYHGDPDITGIKKTTKM